MKASSHPNTRDNTASLLFKKISKNNNPSLGLTTDNAEKAETLANFFVSVFTEDNVINDEVKLFTECTQRHTLCIQPVDVKKKLEKLNISKSPGPDSIHPRILKELSSTISLPLAILFNNTVKQSCIPMEWKEGQITAIYKKGDKKQAGNYRPVSLTSIICKTMESLVRDSIMEYMATNDLFSDKQYGFINGRSTVLQLLTVLDLWTEMLDIGGQIDVIYCDFQKAFDKVSHNKLIERMQGYGIHDSLIQWTKSFLSDRSQRVSVRGTFSKWHNVLSGIPQGSVLGPLLFVLFINSLPDSVTHSHVYLFADDTKVFKHILKEEDQTQMQSDIDSMYTWADQSKLKFHPEKCVHMTLGNNNTPEFRYNMGTRQLKITHEEKDLGVLFDDKLSFDSHISAKINKANSVMGVVRRTFQCLDTRLFKQLFKSLIRPHVEYANQVWYPHTKKHILAIENVQRRATRGVIGLSELSYEERLRKLDLPTLEYRRRRGAMIEIYKMTNDKYDPQVRKILTRAVSTSGTRGHTHKLAKERSRLLLRINSFGLRNVNSWNSLPDHVVTAPNMNTFKNRLDKLWSKHPIMYDIEALGTINDTLYYDLIPEAET